MAIGKDKHAQIDGFLAMCGVGIGATFGTAEMAARFALANEHTALSVTMCLFVGSSSSIVHYTSKAVLMAMVIQVPICRRNGWPRSTICGTGVESSFLYQQSR